MFANVPVMRYNFIKAGMIDSAIMDEVTKCK